MGSVRCFEAQPFSFWLRKGASFAWVDQEGSKGNLPDHDHYGVEIEAGTKVLRSTGGEDWQIRSVAMTTPIRETKNAPRVPLWEVFGNLEPDEESFLDFANKYGRLGPPPDSFNLRSRTIKIKPKPQGEKGRIIDMGLRIDTVGFWAEEVAKFNALLRLDRAVRGGCEDPEGILKGMIEVTPDQYFFQLRHQYGEGVVRAQFSKGDPRWDIAFNRNGLDLKKAGLAFMIDILEYQLEHFPTEMNLEIGGQRATVEGRVEEHPESIRPVLKPSCLLAAMCWSFAEKLMGNLPFKPCKVCNMLGYAGGKGLEKEMVHIIETDEWVHNGSCYECLQKRKHRERKKDEAKKGGAPMRKPGRPRKNKAS